MKTNNRNLLFFFGIFLYAVFPSLAQSEELELINRPVNTSGLTGLLLTTAPFTLPPRTIEIGVASLSENSLDPKYTSTVFPLTVSMGLAGRNEIALLVPFRYLNEYDAGKTRGMGDTELSFKWNALPQPEERIRPGVALFGTGIFPSGDRDAGMNSVSHWGCRIGVSMGSEIAWEDYVIAAYADIQGAFQDLSDMELRDSYAVMNAGILIPISKYRNLQMMAEYNRRKGKDVITIDGVDYSAMTIGLRLVGERFNLSFGSQFMHKDEPGYSKSSRMMGMTSMKF